MDVVDLGATMQALAKAFAPPPGLLKKTFFEVEHDLGKAGTLLKELLCDDDGPGKVKRAIIDALSDEGEEEKK